MLGGKRSPIFYRKKLEVKKNFKILFCAILLVGPSVSSVFCPALPASDFLSYGSKMYQQSEACINEITAPNWCSSAYQEFWVI